MRVCYGAREQGMTTRHEQRKQRADEMAAPAYYFSYVLQLDDGSYYIGSTNAPFARWTEHAVGEGAKATAGHSFTIRMVAPFLSRREAEYNERRLQQALEKDVVSLEALLMVFDQMINVVRPPKTFTELKREEEQHESEMNRLFHHSGRRHQNLPVLTCGYDSWKYKPIGSREPRTTGDWEQLKKWARDEDLTGDINIHGTPVCRRCLDHAP